MIEPPHLILYIVLCGAVILIFIVLLGIMVKNKPGGTPVKDFLKIKLANMIGLGRANCDVEKRFCFGVEDCVHNCQNSSSVGCINGICKTDLNIIPAVNECDPAKGLIGFLDGNTALGTYEFICRSIDPGIAISVDVNKMCFGDPDFVVDYISAYPSIENCKCASQIVIPSTAQIREYVECNSDFIDLVNTAL